MPGTSIWHTCCSRITPLQPRGCAAGHGGNTAVQRARELERQGLVCIIAPDSTEGMSTLTKNRACLEKMYAKGKQDAEALVRWMQNTKQDESVGT